MTMISCYCGVGFMMELSSILKTYIFFALMIVVDLVVLIALGGKKYQVGC